MTTSASTTACSHRGDQAMYTSLRCWAQFRRRQDGTLVLAAHLVVDDDATFGDQACARRASSMLGRMPAATTIMSASIAVPSAKPHRRHGPSSPQDGGRAFTGVDTYQRFDLVAQHLSAIARRAADSSDVLVGCTHRRSRPVVSPYAASRPSRPPPITGRVRRQRACAICSMPLVSAMVRNPKPHAPNGRRPP